MKPYRAFLFVLTLAAMVLAGCSDSDLLEDYQAEQPRILAVRIQDPEAQPGDAVEMELLVGGHKVEQEMETPVDWYLNSVPPELLGTAPYNAPFVLKIPEDTLGENLAWRNLSILAVIRLNGKPLSAAKILRVTPHPVGMNPEIQLVQARRRINNKIEIVEVRLGETISVIGSERNIAFSALMTAIPQEGNQKLIYRWHTSTSGNSAGKLFEEIEQSRIDELFEADHSASASHPDVVFSLKGADGDDPLQSGLYHIYLVVRDNAYTAVSPSDERFGTDFFYFTLAVSEKE